jgi:hypothetical protein
VKYLISQSSSKLWKWHRRLGHLSVNLLCRLSGLGLLRGLPLLKFESNLVWFPCRHGKMITASHSAPRMPQQNGVVERKNRTLIDMARTILDEHKTPRCFWADAISTSCYISNQNFMHSIFNLTPFELRFRRKPSVSHLRPFGCKCFILKHVIWTNLSLILLMTFCLVIHLMADLRECLTLRLTPLLSHAM